LPSLLERITFDGFDETLVAGDERARAAERFLSTPAGREKPGRYWKHDLESLKIDDLAIAPANGTVTIGSVASPRAIVTDLATAARDHRALLDRAFRTFDLATHKYAHLTTAFAGVGAFIYVPADVAIDEPIVVTYHVPAGMAAFPYTVVLAERGARVTVIERIEAQSGAFVAGVAEIVSGEASDVTYASAQMAPDDVRVFFTRVARPGKDSRTQWSVAELGGALAVTDLAVSIEEHGVQANIATMFFPSASQHVDIVSTVDHRVGDSTSQTLVKTAAIGAGQGRYLGNIRIAAHAQGSNAGLRDDALLLSKRAHIDSIPALEIAANDVKAYHGATIGALDDDQIFYMTSRGIERGDAERMIALGFFEPAIDRFPTEALREELRAVLAHKVA
jgi:Fe-S cluster assembly protein SufD